jgi:hypothetical protein
MRLYDNVLYRTRQEGSLNSNTILTYQGEGVAVISIPVSGDGSGVASVIASDEMIVSGAVVGAEETALSRESQIASPAETIPAISGSLP